MLILFRDWCRRVGKPPAEGWQVWWGHGTLQGMVTAPNPCRGFYFPAEVMEHMTWLYHCFSLSLRDVETILAARGQETYEHQAYEILSP